MFLNTIIHNNLNVVHKLLFSCFDRRKYNDDIFERHLFHYVFFYEHYGHIG